MYVCVCAHTCTYVFCCPSLNYLKQLMDFNESSQGAREATAHLQFLCCASTNTASVAYVRNCVMVATVPICVIVITDCVLDRSIASSKVSFPERAIECFLIRFPVSAPLLKVIQWLLHCNGEIPLEGSIRVGSTNGAGRKILNVCVICYGNKCSVLSVNNRLLWAMWSFFVSC